MKILVINAGSSSYKLAIYQIDKAPTDPQKPLWKGVIDWQTLKQANLTASKNDGTFIEKKVPLQTTIEALKCLLKTAIEGETKSINSLSEIDIVGHRVVHGGDLFKEPVAVSPLVKQTIKSLIPLAPLHNPANLEGIELMETLIPKALQVAVFDTAFFSSMPVKASTYAGPYTWREQGIKRYGFHGINHQYCMERCAKILQKDFHTLKIISCHLGNGASIAASEKGICVDTTMGFTPLDGLMMGTRSGALDPGILLHLLEEKKTTPKELSHILNYESGLKGISGSSGDMRQILRLSSEGHSRAKLAYEMYVHSLKRNLGAMAAVLGGIDALIFTAGIGERVSSIREEACLSLKQMGLIIDEKKNREAIGDDVISTKESTASILVIRAEEDWSIAASCWNIAS